MSDTPNNPVMTQPKRAPISKTAANGILQAIGAMAGLGGARQGRRNGKHHGRNAGAFGKQR